MKIQHAQRHCGHQSALCSLLLHFVLLFFLPCFLPFCKIVDTAIRLTAPHPERSLNEHNRVTAGSALLPLGLPLLPFPGVPPLLCQSLSCPHFLPIPLVKGWRPVWQPAWMCLTLATALSCTRMGEGEHHVAKTPAAPPPRRPISRCPTASGGSDAHYWGPPAGVFSRKS